MGLDLTWIAHRSLVYQITGVSPSKQFNRYSKAFFDVAGSFRPLSEAERSEIKEARLHIVRAQDGEVLEKLIGRTNGVWTPAETAVANAIEANTRLDEGQLIKLPVPQAYVPSR